MSEGKNLVGVDIGASSIKVVQLTENRRGVRSLTRFAYHPLPPQTIVDGHIINSAAVVEGLEKLFHKQKMRDVALRVSGHSVIIKKISMPMMSPAELREQINWEAEQHIPFDLAEVEVDYQVLVQRPDIGQMDVLLVAAKKEEVNDLMNVAIEAKLRPKLIDLDAFTIQNAFTAAYGAVPSDQTIGLLHVGASLSTLNILSAGTTSFTRDIANGGNGITEEIHRGLGVSMEEAEAYKCGGDGLGVVPREVPDIINQVCDTLAGEIQRSLDFYLATSGDREVSRVFLSGGCASIRALSNAIERRARVPVEVLDIARIAPPDAKTVDLALFQARASQAVVAMGLALRKDRERLLDDGGPVRINLLPAAKRQARGAQTSGDGSSTPWLVGYGGAALVTGIGLVLMYATTAAKYREQLATNTELESNIQRIQSQAADISSLRADLEKSQELENVVDELQRARFGPTKVLVELMHILSRGGGPTTEPHRLELIRASNPLADYNRNWDSRRVWISSFVEDHRNVTIRGVGKTNDDVAEFLRRLSLSDFFEHVRLMRTDTAVDASTSIDIVTFELQCTIKY